MALYVGGTSVTGSQVLDATKLSGNLPALNASSLTNLDAADLSGTLPAINGSNLTNLPGGGKVLQVVTTTNTTQYACMSGSFIASGLSVSITPSANTSKVWVVASFSGHPSYGEHQGYGGFYTIYRGGTNLGDSTHGMGAVKGSGTHHESHLTLTHLDSPGVSSSTTYKVGFKAAHGQVGTYISYYARRSSITAFEIDGS